MADNIAVIYQEIIYSVGKYPNDKKVTVTKRYDGLSRVVDLSMRCDCGGVATLSRKKRSARYCGHMGTVFNFIKSELISDLFMPCTECGCSNVLCWPTKEKYGIRCVNCYCTEIDKQDL